MTRTALLLYLQNVRDLELARYTLQRKYQNEQAIYTKKRNNLNAAPVPQAAPSAPDSGVESAIVLIIGLLLGGLFTAAFIGLIEKDIWVEHPLIFLFTLAMGPGFLCAVFYRIVRVIVDTHEEKKQYVKDVAATKEYNRQALKDYESRKTSLPTLDRQWNERKRWYQQEQEKLKTTLDSFYSMNIIANQYRNLASVLYIYDYMSSSSATLEDTLIHEHMENGIKRLEAKLDIVIDRMGDMLYETRCMRAENQRNIQTTIDQNNRMLESLQESNQNTSDAAQYARLAANYSKANAYFSLANYLKR